MTTHCTPIPCKAGKGYIHFEQSLADKCVICNPPAVKPVKLETAVFCSRSVKPQIRRIQRCFREVATGWLDERSGRTFKTALAAYESASREGRRIAKADTAACAIVLITWETTTKLGACIVKAFS